LSVKGHKDIVADQPRQKYRLVRHSTRFRHYQTPRTLSPTKLNYKGNSQYNSIPETARERIPTGHMLPRGLKQWRHLLGSRIKRTPRYTCGCSECR